MWKTVHISQNIEDAENIKNLLKSGDILVKLIEKSKDNIEILVPSSELEQAQELILSN